MQSFGAGSILQALDLCQNIALRGGHACPGGAYQRAERSKHARFCLSLLIRAAQGA